MELHFTKMHGLGNDFVVFDFTRAAYPLTAAQANKIADRHFGIGCDQILIVESSTSDDIDFKYRILNADGSEVGQCGNGARCFARYVHDKGLTNKNPVRVETLSGVMTLDLNPTSQMVTVNMGAPRFTPSDIPLNASERQSLYTLQLDDQTIEFSAVSMGNPHAVLLVDDVDAAPVIELGARLETHPMFPERANIGFLQVVSRQEVRVRVFERGSGETIACGSGACAAVVTGIQRGLLDSNVTAELTGGVLNVRWDGENQAVLMTGPAETTFEGRISL
ncbi:diaminopimelate epimerase [Arenicella chitinivorans]|uniref:Diaminopimelate epimerase n=1 Tax=Arenicella chitinivorans TaxID=1329800 RepID=A0A918VSE7_9GAMM|nr:diaminopimelate epimerase [Arenicella chitinivorans]GHA18560.1 diaminopimelate epimerase [Arenicella chitinivorans]